jgi:hypothetical protein
MGAWNVARPHSSSQVGVGSYTIHVRNGVSKDLDVIVGTGKIPLRFDGNSQRWERGDAGAVG